MSLIRCAECNAEISDKALNCPQCGCPREFITKENLLIEIICEECENKYDSKLEMCPSCGCPNESYNQAIDNNDIETIEEQDKEDLNNLKYKGVKGWLLFYCITLIVFQPFIMIGALLYIEEITSLFPYFPGVQTVLIIDTILSLCVLGFGIYSAILLIKIKDNAISTVKKFLVTALIYNFISSVLFFASGLPPEVIEAMAGEIILDLIPGLIYFFIWYSYFNKSKRVKATYINQV